MSDSEEGQVWPRQCPLCSTDLVSAVIDFDPSNDSRAELQPGEMAAVDYCPNPDCPGKKDDAEV